MPRRRESQDADDLQRQLDPDSPLQNRTPDFPLDLPDAVAVLHCRVFRLPDGRFRRLQSGLRPAVTWCAATASR